VSLVVRAAPGQAPAVAAAVMDLAGAVTAPLALIDGFAVTLPADHVAELADRPGVVSVTPNASVTMATAAAPLSVGPGVRDTGYDPTTDPNAASALAAIVGAPAAWLAGYTGGGVDIAVIDTGVVPSRNLDRARVVHGPDLSPEGIAGPAGRRDGYGHGTFVAGLVAGRDEASDLTDLARRLESRDGGGDRQYVGIAPEARIVSVKVADRNGETDVARVILALDWVVQHRRSGGLDIRVVNLSFSTNSAQPYQLDPLAYAVERAWHAGLVVVTAAGNSGSVDGRLTMPAADPYVIAVGAAMTQGTRDVVDDEIPTFSSRGDGVRNPDLVAPGVSVQGLRVPGSFVDRAFGATARLDAEYFRGSGTSQAAALVSGAAALLLQQRPDLTPDQVKSVLVSTARPLPAADRQAQGAGLLDIDAALAAPTPSNAAQDHPRAAGSGSVELSRGTPRHRPGQWRGEVWSGSTWSGSTWSGSTWSGSTWSGSTWSGSTWSTGAWE
jgi:serine protease AprX